MSGGGGSGGAPAGSKPVAFKALAQQLKDVSLVKEPSVGRNRPSCKLVQELEAFFPNRTPEDLLRNNRTCESVWVLEAWHFKNWLVFYKGKDIIVRDHAVWSTLDDASLNFAGTLLGIPDTSAEIVEESRAAIIKFLAKSEVQPRRGSGSDGEGSDDDGQPNFFELARSAGVEDLMDKEPAEFLKEFSEVIHHVVEENHQQAAWALAWFQAVTAGEKINQSTQHTLQTLGDAELRLLQDLSGHNFLRLDNRVKAARVWAAAIKALRTPHATPQKRRPRERDSQSQSPVDLTGAADKLRVRLFASGNSDTGETAWRRPRVLRKPEIPFTFLQSQWIDHTYTSKETNAETRSQKTASGLSSGFLALLAVNTGPVPLASQIVLSVTGVNHARNWVGAGIMLARANTYTIVDGIGFAFVTHGSSLETTRMKLHSELKDLASASSWHAVSSLSSSVEKWYADRLALRSAIFGEYDCDTDPDKALVAQSAQRQVQSLPNFFSNLRRKIEESTEHLSGDSKYVARGKAWHDVWQLTLAAIPGAILSAARRQEKLLGSSKKKEESDTGSESDSHSKRPTKSAKSSAQQTGGQQSGRSQQGAVPNQGQLGGSGPKTLCVPLSASIIGPKGITLVGSVPDRYRCKRCPIAGDHHHGWECPLLYATKLLEPCPGFDQQGNRLVSAFKASGKMRRSTREAWAEYIRKHGLQPCHVFKKLAYKPDFTNDDAAPPGEVPHP
jgi:hypothetical protein